MSRSPCCFCSVGSESSSVTSRCRAASSFLCLPFLSPLPSSQQHRAAERSTERWAGQVEGGGGLGLLGCS